MQETQHIAGFLTPGDIGLTIPPKPQYRAQWAPVYIQPIAASGEKICIGIAAVGDDGQTQTVIALPPDALRAAFGKHGEALHRIAAMAMEDCLEFIRNGGWLTHWQPPLEGVSIGGPRPATAQNMTGVLRQGLMMSACFSALLVDPAKEDLSEDKQEAEEDRWPKQVQNATLLQAPKLSNCFDKYFYITPGARRTPIDFIGRNLAAGFGKVIPTGQQLSMSVKNAKVTLWNLNALRKKPDLFPCAHYELLLYKPSEDDPSYADKQITAMQSALLELTEEGKQYQLHVQPVGSAEEAAGRIVKQEAQ